jgi:hypothetical protein
MNHGNGLPNTVTMAVLLIVDRNKVDIRIHLCALVISYMVTKYPNGIPAIADNKGDPKMLINGFVANRIPISEPVKPTD